MLPQPGAWRRDRHVKALLVANALALLLILVIFAVYRASTSPSGQGPTVLPGLPSSTLPGPTASPGPTTSPGLPSPTGSTPPGPIVSPNPTASPDSSVSPGLLSPTGSTTTGPTPPGPIVSPDPTVSTLPSRPSPPPTMEDDYARPTIEGFEKVEVAPGDTLWDLARMHLKDPFRWADIFYASRCERQPYGQLSDPDRIFPGWVVLVPALDAKTPTRTCLP